MKKRMKKAVALAATAAMVASLPVSAVTTQAADDITIGVSIWSSQTYSEARVKRSSTKQQKLLVLT